jgi:branched-chain amino acid transport system ATP-binding protein
MILRTEKLSKNFGSVQAVDVVSLAVPEGQMRAIIGPNGAGKTTLLDLIVNRIRPSSGRVYFKEKDITHWPPHNIAKIGIGKCFQISKIFPELTTFQNIEIACISKLGRTYNMYSPGSSNLAQDVRRIMHSIGLEN